MFHSTRKARPTLWLAWTLIGATAAALVVISPSVKAAPASEAEQPKKEEPKKEEPKKDQPKKTDLPPGFPDLDDLIKKLPGSVDPQQMEQFRKEIQKAQEEMRKAVDEIRQLQGRPGGIAGPGFPFGRPHEGRLGVVLSKPADVLADQLDLPKGQGLVLERVEADSAAAKAGLKPNDILLELNGKPVPNDMREFVKNIDDIKPDTAVNATVLRKGKKETVKGLKLPEAKPEQLPGRRLPRINIPPIQPGQGLLGNAPGVLTTTVTRRDGNVTTTHHEGALTITITSTTEDGKTKLGEIRVQDGAETNTYQSMDKVPEKYRDKVKGLIEMSEKKGGGVKLDLRLP